MNEKTKSKMTSRKFIVWTIATMYMAMCFVFGFLSGNMQIVSDFTPVWGGLSMLYIGGNVAQKFIVRGKDECR